MLRIVLFVGLIYLALFVQAQTQLPDCFIGMNTWAEIQSSIDLYEYAEKQYHQVIQDESYTIPHITQKLWSLATECSFILSDMKIGRFDDGGNYVDLERELQEAIIRHVFFAIALELIAQDRTEAFEQWTQEESLLQVGIGSVTSVEAFFSDEAIQHLFQHFPSIERYDSRAWYRYIRVNAGALSFIQEQADTPFLDLAVAPNWTRTSLTSTEENIEGYFYKIPLIAINDIIIALKMDYFKSFLLRDAVPLSYLDIISANAIYASSLYGNTGLGELAVKRYRTILRNNALSPYLRNRVDTRLTKAFYFARDYTHALKRYESTVTDFYPVSYQFTGMFGSAMSLLALNRNEEALKRLYSTIPLISPNDIKKQYYVLAVHDMLQQAGLSNADEVMIVKLRQWRQEHLSKFESADLQWVRYEQLNRDILRTLFAARRYELVLYHLFREVVAIRESALWSETFYLREIAATLNDVFELLAWDDYNEGSPILKQLSLELGCDIVPLGSPATSEELILENPQDCRDYYAARNPEEDRAETLRFYLSDPKGFLAWIDNELARDEPNVEPFLKLLWIEWFLIPLQDFKNPHIDIDTWEYNPYARSGRSDMASVEIFFNRYESFIKGDAKLAYEAFLEAFSFFSELY